MAAERFADEKYVSWLKVSLSLQFAKEGLETFTDDEVNKFHSNINPGSSGSGVHTCNNKKDLKKQWQKGKFTCKADNCDKWLAAIQSNHDNPSSSVEWDNSDISQLSRHQWACAKLFMPYGCKTHCSAEDADIAALLTLYLRCTHFHSYFANVRDCKQIKDIRNRTMHSSSMEVETSDMQRDTATIIAFLEDPNHLLHVPGCKDAVNNIKKLLAGKTELSLNKKLELQALHSKLRHVEDDVDQLMTSSNDLNDSYSDLLDRVQTVEAGKASDDEKLKRIQSDTQTMKLEVDSTQEQLSEVKSKMKAFDDFVTANDINGVNTEKISNKIDSVERGMRNLTELVCGLVDRISKLETRVTVVEVETRSLKRKFEEMDKTLKSKETRQSISEDRIKALRASLIKHYRDNSLHVKIPVVGHDLAMEDIYVVPDIKVLREADKPQGVLSTVQNHKSTRNTSICKQIFYTKDYNNKHIYTTADAGMGKTTFCKYLVNLWCEAHNESRSDSPESQTNCPKSRSDNPIQSNSSEENPQGQKTQAKEEDKTIMSSFKLLFYITLRDSAKLYKLDEIIDFQILQSSRKTKSLKASDVLQTEGCLVIIDGLDEWACPEGVEVPHYVNPGIPGKLDFNSNTVFLTTTRPWKYEVLNLSNKDVDKYAELVGFDRKSADDLCFKLFKVMNKAESVKKTVQAFEADIQTKGLRHLCNIPVILTVLVCLWFDTQSLGKSQIQLYCSMLEMLLKRANKNFPKQTCASKLETAREEMQLPECFLSHEHCQTYQMLIVKLCKVAFEALFNQKREQALVFESSQMGILGVDHINVDLCLKSGILSQSKVLGKWSRCEKKLSFLHKKLQEFLAAVFITCANEESIISRVKQFCTSVESMLEMSQVWMFLSGINSDLAKQLLTDLMTSVVLKDSRLQQYRHTLTYEDMLVQPALAQSIQACILECVEEATCNGHNDLCLPLEDFVINRQTISTCLERLLTFNTAAIKYVRIDTLGMEPNTVERVMCQLQDTQCLQKLHLNDPSSDITKMQSLHLVDPSSAITTKQPLCKTLDNNKDSLTCLQLKFITLTTELYDAVCRALTHVTALNLWHVTLTHKQIEQLFLSVSQAQHIRQLKLVLFCTDHGYQCRALIDVSGLTQLRTLYLQDMYIARLPEMTDCLESVALQRVTISGNSDKPADLTDLKHNPKLVVTECRYNDRKKWWDIKFHTKQQTTTASDNQN